MSLQILFQQPICMYPAPGFTNPPHAILIGIIGIRDRHPVAGFIV
jgi:hypothetical protein